MVSGAGHWLIPGCLPDLGELTAGIQVNRNWNGGLSQRRCGCRGISKELELVLLDEE